MNTRVLELLIGKGADIMAMNYAGLLPLGNAVTWKAGGGVNILCQQLLKENKPPAGAALPYAWSIIPFLFRNHDLRWLAKSGHTNIESSPFWKVLEILLQYYKDQIVHCGKLIDWINDLQPKYVTSSGLVDAIWLGNFKIVGRILDSGKFRPDLRYLLCEAHLARFYLFQPDETGNDKPLDEDDERYGKVIKLLEDRDVPSYKERRTERLDANRHL